MPPQWRIDIRLGLAPDAAPIRSLIVEAPTEAQALTLAAAAAARDGEAAEQLLVDGQEEVFSRAEVDDGVIEHQADT